MSSVKTLRIAITTGEPAGVGPELMYHLSRHNAATLPLHARCATPEEGGIKTEDLASTEVEIVLIGSKTLLEERMKLFGDDFVLHDFDESVFVKSGPDASGLGHLTCLNIDLACPSIPGVQDVNNSKYVLSTLDCAIEYCQKGIFDAMVTAPISKAVIAKTGIEFTGHTEYLQEECSCKEVVMMLGCSKMNVALVTTHLPLNTISAAITKEKLTDIITILHHDLKEHMGFAKPKIYVCGLNPHAGEDGTLGKEELEIIIPTLEELKSSKGFDLIGPLPADTVFQKKYLDNAAAILTMYHDQGLPVLKYAGFDEGYNTTLGLPFIRTSVDHGTACDLAGKGIADEGSLLSAVSLAVHMAHNRKSRHPA